MLFSKQYLVKLIMPLIAEQFLAMTIGTVDTVMVSSIGQTGVSGVSLVDQLSQLFVQLFAAFATGGTVVASQYLGRKDLSNAQNAAHQLLNLATFAGLFLLAVCMPLRYQILKLIFGGAEEAILNNAVIYFSWILISFPFLAVYNCCAALFRSMGNSKISLKVSLVMNGINIAGNAALIYGAKIGVAGAGISTALSRIVAMILMLVVMSKKGEDRICFEAKKLLSIRFDLIRKILKIAIPSGIENSVFHIGKTLVYAFMSGFGTVAISANAISNTICSFSNIPGNAIGLSTVTVIGQCIGAGEKEQAKSYGKKLLVWAYSSMSILCVLIGIFAPFVVRIFGLPLETENLASGIVRSCMIANIFFWPMSFIMPNVLRGAGDAKYTMIVSNITMWAFRVLFSYIISSFLLKKFPDNTSIALYGVWCGMYLDWFFRGLFFFIRFRGKRWLEKSVI